MKWKKLGKIFDPADITEWNDCRVFTQSPQAIAFEDFIRVYFSTRTIDPNNGKYLSHVAFADFSTDFLSLRRVSTHQVIPLGGLGAFDEHGIFPFHVVKRGTEIHAYTNGWSRRVSVSVETGIGLAVSTDGGETFVRRGVGPVLTATLQEPNLVGDAFVREYAGRLHMWYIFGTGWRRFKPNSQPDRTYKIGHAVSDDGCKWHKEEARQIINDRLGPDESQALPTVIDFDGSYLMAFCYRQSFDFRNNPERSYRIGFARSDDLINWTRYDNTFDLPMEPSSWDAEMECYPHLIRIEGKVYMIYNGNEFGRYGFGLAVLEQ